MKYLFALLVSLPAFAGAPLTPPTAIDQPSHARWVAEINGAVSPYEDFIFAWLNEQTGKPLPAQVSTDPDKLVVAVDRVLAEAVKKEDSGEVQEATSYGLESFALLDAPVGTVLETILFRWGKPVGQKEGVTYPYDLVYGYRQEKLVAEWGPDSYHTYTVKKNGGIAKEMNDAFSLLVRGNETEGYVLVGDFIAPTGPTEDTTSLTIITIRPTADGKTDYRVVGLQTGQSYSFLGKEQGRKNFGFNAKRIRDGQKDFMSQVAALKNTGKIPERKP